MRRLAGDGQPGREDVRPRGGLVGRRVGLHERERVIGVELTPHGDLGDGPGGRGGLVDDPCRQGPDRDLRGRDAVGLREGDREDLEGEGSAATRRGVGWDPDPKVGRHDERPGPDQQDRAGPPVQPMREGVVREGAVGIDAGRDDLGHRVGLDDVDPLEGRDHRVLRRPEGGRGRRQPDVAAPLGREAVGEMAQLGERPLAAGGRRVDLLCVRPGPDGGRRVAIRDLEADALEPLRQLPADRHLDPDQVRARRDQLVHLVERALEVRLHDRRPDPRRGGLTEQVDDLAPGDPVGIDPVDRGRGPAASPRPRPPRRRSGRRRRSDSRPRSTDPGRHVEGELLRVEVVLEEAHRERQGDAPAEAAPVAREPAIHGRTGERPAGRVEPGDPEQPEHRPFLTERGRRPRTRRERGGQGIGAFDETVERAPVGPHPVPPACSRPAARSRSSVRSTGSPRAT